MIENRSLAAFPPLSATRCQALAIRSLHVQVHVPSCLVSFLSFVVFDPRWQVPAVPKLWTELTLRECLRACSGWGQLVALRICELDSSFRLVRGARLVHSMGLIRPVKRSLPPMERILLPEARRRRVPGGADACQVVLTRPVKQ
jgi:hypothetical protein